MECRLQPRCRVDEKERIIDETILAEFSEEHLGNRLISRRREFDVQQAVRAWIDRCVRSEPFAVEPGHSLVNCDVTPVGTIERL